MTEGRPIAEAPKDRPILAYDPEVNPAEARFAVIQWRSYGGEWEVIHDHEDYRWSYGAYNPTLWWELPTV